MRRTKAREWEKCLRNLNLFSLTKTEVAGRNVTKDKAKVGDRSQ